MEVFGFNFQFKFLNFLDVLVNFHWKFLIVKFGYSFKFQVDFQDGSNFYKQ